MILRTFILLAVWLGLQSAFAAAPKRTAAFGIELGATPQSVSASLSAQYELCVPLKRIYHQTPGDSAEYTAALTINPGLSSRDLATSDVCPDSPAGNGITDAVDARFVHPEIDPAQRLYSIEAHRLYPDVVHGRPPRLRNSFDELRAELFRTYGRPIDERREQVASSAANLAKGLGIRDAVEREDYLVRYLGRPGAGWRNRKSRGPRVIATGPT